MIRLAILAACIAAPVAAEPGSGLTCAARNVLVNVATMAGGELVASGLDDDGTAIEIFADEGEFFVIATPPSGRSCVVSSGSGWWVAIPGVPA